MTDTDALVLGFKWAAAYVLLKFAVNCKFDDLDNPAFAIGINRRTSR